MSDQDLKDVKKDIYLMMKKAEQMIELSEDAFAKNKAAALDQADEVAAEIRKKEVHLTGLLSKIASSGGEARSILSVPSHIDQVASSISRMNEGIRLKIREGLLFSDKAMREVGSLFTKTREMLKKAGEASVTKESAVKAVVAEADEVIKMSEGYATTHEDRLVAGECSPKSSSTYLCMLYSVEDVAAHTKEMLKKLTGK